MDDLKEKLETLAKDEEEAIEGYDKVIEELDDDSPIVAQLKKIRDEEKAHLEFLNKAKEDPDLKYEDPAHEEEKVEKVEVVGEEDENNDEKEREQASILFKINL